MKDIIAIKGADVLPASKRLIKFGHNVASLNELQVALNCNDQFIVEYDDSFVKDGIALIGEYGVGNTFESACEDYLNKITGKKLVFNPSDEEQRVEVVIL